MLQSKIIKTIRRITCNAGILSLILMTGCLENPNTEYVSNKEGLGNLITSNIATDAGVPIQQQVHAPEQVSWDCEAAGAEVGIHAAVIIPEVTAVPIWQLRQKELNRDLLEFYAETIFEEGKIRNTAYYTKETIDHRVDYLTEFLENGCLSDGTPLDEIILETDSGRKTLADDIRDYIPVLYEDYEGLSEKPSYGDAVDYSFVTEHTTIGYGGTARAMPYDWEYGTATGIYNGKEYNLTLETDGMNAAVRFALDEYETTVYGYDYRCIEYQKNALNSHEDREAESTCTLSRDEAAALCRDFLTQLGMEHMETNEIEELALWESGQDGIPEYNYLGNKGYLILFHRGYNSMQDISVHLSTKDILEQSNSIQQIAFECFQEKYSYEEAMQEELQENEAFGKESQEEEVIVKTVPELAAFIVTDDGITYAWIQNPMEEEVCLAENVMLLDFERVEAQAKAHFETLYADAEEEATATFVELNYAAMWSPNQEGEYIMIPVWDFRHGNKVFVSINAIDGTVFDREQGY